MDYTTVFRPLIYKDREDIDDFPVDETDNIKYLTMETVFMEKLEARPFIKENYNAPELLLMIFNNARYITTLIFSENHPQHYLHKYLKIAENYSVESIMCYHAKPATMALVVNYLLHYLGEIYYGSKIVKAIINNFNDWDINGEPEGKKDFFNLLIERTSETDKYRNWVTDDGDFPRRNLFEVLNDNDIDPCEIIGGIDYIIQEALGLYSGDPECIQIIKAVITLMENYERTEPINETTREMLDNAYHKLRKLKKQSPGCMPKWEEDSSYIITSKHDMGVIDLSLQSSRMVNPIFDADTEILRGQIDDLKEEVNQLERENAKLKQQLEDIEPEKAFTATGNECFTKAKMGLLIYTIASMKDGPTPVKAQLVSIISAIGGWEPTSVSTEMKKAGFNQSDIDAVAKLFKNAMPKFALEIKKQIPRRPKTKK